MWNRYLSELDHALAQVRAPALGALVNNLHAVRQVGRTVFTCGNGGSASSASHLAQDLTKGTLDLSVPAIRAVCLCDSLPSLTAWGNDSGYEFVFSEPLRVLGHQNDVLIAISGSGNSPNVLNAVEAAHDLEMRTWGVCGFDGGKLMHLAHRCVHVPCHNMGMVEAAHGVIFHWLIDALRARAQGLSIMDSDL